MGLGRGKAAVLDLTESEGRGALDQPSRMVAGVRLDHRFGGEWCF